MPTVYRALPSPDLFPYIDNFFDLEAQRDSPDLLSDIILPQMPALYVFLGGTAKVSYASGDWIDMPSICLSGPVTAPIQLRYHIPGRVVGLGLQPAGWRALTGAAPASVTNRLIEADAAPSPALAKLQAVLRETKPGEDIFSLLNSAFGELFKQRGTPQDPRSIKVRNMILVGKARRVEDLSRALDISPRQLTRLIKDAFGLRPQTLLQIARFQRVMIRAMQQRERDWKQLVGEDYADQSHFIRDFKRFTGLPPSQYYAMPHPIFDGIVLSRLRLLNANFVIVPPDGR